MKRSKKTPILFSGTPKIKTGSYPFKKDIHDFCVLFSREDGELSNVTRQSQYIFASVSFSRK